MKKFLLCVLFFLPFNLFGQPNEKSRNNQKEEYRFTDVKALAATPVKDQNSSGTCWSFAGIAMIESELLASGKGTYDLSEMWIVRHCYHEKAIKFARMQGKINFGGGGATHDVFDAIRKYGIVPEEVYTGLQYGTDKHQHGELDAVLAAYMNAVITNPNKSELSTKWLDGFDAILDAYLGELPDTFVYDGVEYTPLSFAESLGLDMDDYVSFTSYTHHPFYTRFAIEVPDNWAWGLSYNVPLEEMMALIEASIEAGHTVEWAADVSESGFKYRKSYAVVPRMQSEFLNNTEKDKWVAQSAENRSIEKNRIPVEEAVITQDMRQKAFDNYRTTDDHGMLITGIAVDQEGNRFYKVKNSWGEGSSTAGGYFYASAPYVAYKTMNIVVNKSVIPKDLRKKLGLK